MVSGLNSITWYLEVLLAANQIYIFFSFMQTINRLVFSGDVFRTKHGERNQLDSVRWLYKTFGSLLECITGLKGEIRLAGKAPFEGSDTLKEWYAILGEQELKASAWCKTFWNQPPQALIEAIRPEYENALVIFSEMSPFLKKILDELAVPWIDVVGNPIRFMADFVVTLKVSSHFEGKFPEAALLKDEEIAYGVERVRNYYAKNKSITEDLEGSIVFFAQTSQDRILIKDHGFAGAAEAIEGLQEIRKGRKIYIKPHPIEPQNPIIKELVDKFDAQVVDWPSYEILASDQDLTVATISSSVGWEARYFNKNSIIFHPEVMNWCYNGYSTLYYTLSDELWGPLLGSVMPVHKVNSKPWRPQLISGAFNSYGLDPKIWKGFKRNVGGKEQENLWRQWFSKIWIH